MKYLKLIVISTLIFVPLLIIGIQLISLSNSDTRLRNQFKQKIDERTAFYDNMWKTIAQKSQIALKNDSSFYRNINAIMSSRKDASGLFMKWVKESNPNANYQEVSKLYSDLSRTVESKRDEFFEREKMLQDIKLQSDNLLTLFPSGWILRNIFGRKYLVYKPITSDRTDEVMTTGKDNNVQLF
jgi:hypothetical protein